MADRELGRELGSKSYLSQGKRKRLVINEESAFKSLRLPRCFSLN
jgi:hypothetical protein